MREDHRRIPEMALQGPIRTDTLVAEYNRRFNSLRAPRYDGSNCAYPGCRITSHRTSTSATPSPASSLNPPPCSTMSSVRQDRHHADGRDGAAPTRRGAPTVDNKKARAATLTNSPAQTLPTRRGPHAQTMNPASAPPGSTPRSWRPVPGSGLLLGAALPATLWQPPGGQVLNPFQGCVTAGYGKREFDERIPITVRLPTVGRYRPPRRRLFLGRR